MSYDAWGDSWGASSAWGVSWVHGGGTQTGTGGIDPPRRSVKPTGLLERKQEAKRHDTRIDDAREDQAEIASRLAREFGEESAGIEAAAALARAAEIQARMSQAEIDAEIGLILRNKLRTEEDELMLLILMAAGTT